MATYKLDDTSWKELDFPEKIWNIKPEFPSQFVTDLNPSVTKITTLSENKDFRWFYGRFVTVGGNIRLTYPEVLTSEETVDGEQILIVPNYCFSYYPFLKVTVEGKKFLGWYNYSNEKLLQVERELIISETDFRDVTTFLAKFEG